MLRQDWNGGEEGSLVLRIKASPEYEVRRGGGEVAAEDGW